VERLDNPVTSLRYVPGFHAYCLFQNFINESNHSKIFLKKIKNFEKFFKKTLDTSCKISKIVYPIALMNVNCFSNAVIVRLMKKIFLKSSSSNKHESASG